MRCVALSVCLGTCSVDQVGFELRDLPASVPVAGIWVCAVAATPKLLSYRTQDHQPRAVPLTVGLALPNQRLIKKMPPGLPT